MNTSEHPDGTDDPMNASFEAESPGTTTIDLSEYDLDTLRADVTELWDLPSAIGDTMLWAMRGVGAAAVVAWFVGRGLPAWALILFIVITVLLALVAVIVISVYLVVRQRVQNAVATSERVLETVVLIRDDIYHVSEGRKQVSTRDLASDVLEDVVFPVMVDGAVSMLPGPLSLLARPVVWLPRKLIGRTVGAAIEHLPLERLDRDVVVNNRALIKADAEVERAQGNLVAVLAAHDTIEVIVLGVIKALWWPTLVVTALTSIPLVVWLLLGSFAG